MKEQVTSEDKDRFLQHQRRNHDLRVRRLIKCTTKLWERVVKMCLEEEIMNYASLQRASSQHPCHEAIFSQLVHSSVQISFHHIHRISPLVTSACSLKWKVCSKELIFSVLRWLKMADLLNIVSANNLQHWFEQWKICVQWCMDRGQEYTEGERN
jgi:hypothetical protein